MKGLVLPHHLTRSFTLRVPQTNAPDSPCWIVDCVILNANEQSITTHFTCQDWLTSSFVLPTPVKIATLYECIYLSVCEIITEERINWLCAQ